MPSLAPHGETILNLRRALGYTQLELARRVGVSERTVRNAERGQAIKHDFLKFIASGLGVSVEDVVEPSGEWNVHSRWQRNVERLMVGIGRMLIERDPSVLLAIADRDIVLRREGGIPGLAFGHQLFGEFHGALEIRRLLEESRQFWQACGDVDYYVQVARGRGRRRCSAVRSRSSTAKRRLRLGALSRRLRVRQGTARPRR